MYGIDVKKGTQNKTVAPRSPRNHLRTGGCATYIVNWLLRKPLLFSYSLVFVLIGCIAFSPILVNGKSLIYISDGISQSFSTFVYTGTTIRAGIRSFIAGEGFFLPAFNLSMGFGLPEAYPRDPLVYLSALCPARYAEALFNFLVVFRLWLTGAAFMLLARELRFTRTATFAAMLVFAFSSNALQCIQQPSYLLNAILFPLILLGVVRFLHGKGIWIYLFASAAFCLIRGLYLTYMAQILVAVFVLVYLAIHKPPVKTYLKTAGLFLVALLTATGIAAPSAIEDFISLSSLDRLDVKYETPIFWPLEYYGEFLSAWLGMMDSRKDSFFGFGALAVLCIALLLGDKTKPARIMKILLALCTIFMLFPIFGLAFNGFSYPANRWNFGFDVLVACIVGQVLGSNSLCQRSFKAAATMLGIYAIALCASPYSWDVAAFQQLCIMFVLFLLGYRVNRASQYPPNTTPQRRPKEPQSHITQPAFLIIAVLALGLNYAMYLSPYGKNGINNVWNAGVAYERVGYNTPSLLMKGKPTQNLFRYDKTYDLGMVGASQAVSLNAPRVVGVYGIDSYTSFYDPSVSRLTAEVALAGMKYLSITNSLDARAYLEQLSGVGYYLQGENDGLGKPYGAKAKAKAELTAFNDMQYKLLPITNAASMAQLFDNAVKRSDYLELSPIQRQEALLQGAVLDDNLTTRENTVKPNPKSFSQSFTYTTSGNIEVANNTIRVAAAGSSINLSFSPAPECEQYLYVNGLTYTGVTPRQQYSDEEWELLPQSAKMATLRSTLSWTKPFTCSIECKSANSSGTLVFANLNNGASSGRNEWLWNLGYFKKGINAATLVFQRPGIYSFEEFGVYAQPMETLDAARSKAAQGEVANLSYDCRNAQISCDTTTTSNQYLLLSVPYRSEWQAAIDGKPINVMKANTAFMAIELPKGNHHVEFTFHSRMPFFTGIGLTALALTLLVWRISKKRKTHQPATIGKRQEATQ